MSKRESYLKRMEQKLADWTARLETLKVKAGETGSTVKAEIRDRLGEWKIAGETASAKLIELRAAAVKWSMIRNEIETAWEAMDSALTSAEPARAATEATVVRLRPRESA